MQIYAKKCNIQIKLEKMSIIFVSGHGELFRKKVWTEKAGPFYCLLILPFPY